jgi:hypothetical protein
VLTTRSYTERDANDPAPPLRPASAEVTVDLRELTKCLPPSHVQLQRFICGIVPDRCPPSAPGPSGPLTRGCPGICARSSLVLYLELQGDSQLYVTLPAKGD